MNQINTIILLVFVFAIGLLGYEIAFIGKMPTGGWSFVIGVALLPLIGYLFGRAYITYDYQEEGIKVTTIR